jgi:hypothetical protein
MGLFGKIGEAKFSEGGIYILPGVYLLEIQELKAIKTRTQKDAYVAEFKVLESTNPERLPGSTCSWMVTMDKEPAMGNIKQFLSAVLKVEMDAIDESVAEYSVNEVDDPKTNRVANPCKGKIVRCSAVNIKTKGKGADFTKCKYFQDTDATGAAKDHAANART